MKTYNNNIKTKEKIMLFVSYSLAVMCEHEWYAEQDTTSIDCTVRTSQTCIPPSNIITKSVCIVSVGIIHRAGK